MVKKSQKLVNIVCERSLIGHFYQSVLIEYQEILKLEKSDEFLGLKANLTLIEPKFGPWGPDPTPKVGSIWGYFLDFTWIPKLDQYFGHKNP